VQPIPRIVCDQVEHVLSSVAQPVNPFAYRQGVYLG
jgi:hypothetical protein